MNLAAGLEVSSNLPTCPSSLSVPQFLTCKMRHNRTYSWRWCLDLHEKDHRGQMFFGMTQHPFHFHICIYIGCTAMWGVLVPWSGIKPVSAAVEVQSPNYWTAREFPSLSSGNCILTCLEERTLLSQSVWFEWGWSLGKGLCNSALKQPASL